MIIKRNNRYDPPRLRVVGDDDQDEGTAGVPVRA